MTVAVNDTIERYTITGVGPYAYTWRIFNDTDLVVVALSTASPPVVVPLTYLTHYTVSGANASAGGSITLTAAAYPTYSGYTLDIRSATPRSQPTSIRNQARFLPEIHEDAFDCLDRQIQDLGRLVDASVRSPDNEPALAMVLPALASRIGKYQAFDLNGQPIASAGTGNDSALRTDLAAPAGANLIGGLYVPNDVRKSGAIGNGSVAGGSGTNDAAAFATANAIGTPVVVAGGLIYRIGTNTTITAPLIISGAQISVDSGVTLTLNGPVQINSPSPFTGPGYVAFGNSARPGRVVNVLPDFSSGIPVRGGMKLHAYGDSFTAGFGVTAANCFPAQIASNLNSVLNNHGQSGRGVTRATLEAYTSLPKYGSRNQLVTHLAGFNDMLYGGTNSKTFIKLQSEMKAFLANAFLKTAAAASDAGVTKTGAWTNATGGTWADKSSASLAGNAMFSGVSANKISYPFNGTNVVAAYYQSDGVTRVLSTFDVYIDGAFVESISPVVTTDGNAGFPETYEGMTHAVLIYTALGTGAHTIELRQTSNNLLVVDYFGTFSAPGDCPSVIVGEIPHVNAAGYAGPESPRTKAIDDTGSAALRAAVQFFQALGYPVAWVPVNDYYNYQTNIQGDNVHPTLAGYTQIAAAYLGYTRPANANTLPSCRIAMSATQSIPNAALTDMTFATSNGDQWGFWNVANPTRIVAPFTGTYAINGIISWAPNAAGVRNATINVNGGGSIQRIMGLVPFLNGDNIATIYAEVDLTVGDYITVNVSQNSGGALNLQADCRMSVSVIR